jgi:threonine dehydrogenase-like Zn-dependent dehydrogenase
LIWSATISAWPDAATTTAKASALSGQASTTVQREIADEHNVTTVAVIGSGTMGAGIAEVAAAAGIRC